jgi:dTDP-4-amino-4,6-dideoxygalactose transaminase
MIYDYRFHHTLRIVDADRNGLMQHLLDKGIPCYLLPNSFTCSKAYLDERYKEEDFPVTNQLVKEVLSFPMHTELDDQQIQFITDTCGVFTKNNNKRHVNGRLYLCTILV